MRKKHGTKRQRILILRRYFVLLVGVALCVGHFRLLQSFHHRGPVPWASPFVFTSNTESIIEHNDVPPVSAIVTSNNTTSVNNQQSLFAATSLDKKVNLSPFASKDSFGLQMPILQHVGEKEISIPSTTTLHSQKKQYYLTEHARTMAGSTKQFSHPSISTRSFDRDDAFSACLLVMDENYHLNEWIAYHYFTLKLRYLIIAVDPNSRELPTRTIQRWREAKWNVTITEWTDSDYISVEQRANLQRQKNDTPKQGRERHLQRQIYFYQSCIKFLIQQNRSWTAFIDVDEFITIDSSAYQSARANHSHDILLQPYGILSLVKKYARTNVADRDPADPPEWYRQFQDNPCVFLPRTLIGSSESSATEVSRNVPAIFAANNLSRQFESLRWRYLSTVDAGPGKSIVDVSKVKPHHFVVPAAPRRSLFHNRFNIGVTAHRPLPVCLYEVSSLPLQVYHFMRSWEAYPYRDDPRNGVWRNKQIWTDRSAESNGHTDVLRPWLTGFVNLVGENEAYRLLHDIGIPFVYNASETCIIDSHSTHRLPT